MDGFGSLSGFWGMVRGSFSRYRNPAALKLLEERAGHAPASVASPAPALEETRA